MRSGRYRIACRRSRIPTAAGFHWRRDAEPSAQVIERAVDGQRRGSEDRRLHAVEQVLAHDGRDVDRGSAQEHTAAAELHEVDVVRSPARRRNRSSSRSCPARRANVAASVGVVVPVRCVFSSPRTGRQQRQGRFDEVERAGQIRRRAVGSPSDSAVARTRSSFLTRPSPRCAKGELAEERARVIAELDEPPCAISSLSQFCSASASSRSTSRAQFLDAVGADADSEVLGRDVFELVRFVENHAGEGRDDLAVTRSASPRHRRRAGDG